MIEKIITGIVVVVLVGFVGFILKDYFKKRKDSKKPEPARGGEEGKNRELPDIKKIMSRKEEPGLFNGPVIYVREEKGGAWKDYQMTKTVITIGKKGTICIDKDYFADKQFEIRRCIDGNEEYYLFTELGKINRTEYFDKGINDFRKLVYKDELELEEGEREVFYVGNVKFVIDVPYTHHKVVASDIVPSVGNEESTQRKRKTTRVDRKNEGHEILNKKVNANEKDTKTSDFGGFDVNI